MKCVVLQPSYIPWRGVFDQIQRADVFVFYDDVQYDRRGFRNRNQLKTRNGKLWLTIPVRSRGNQIERTPINKIEIAWDTAWSKQHLDSFRHAYAKKAPYFREYEPLLQEFYARKDRLLADFTIDFTLALAKILGLNQTKFVRSSELGIAEGTRTDRLLSVLQRVGATHYISGPSARGYIEEEKLAAANISLEYVHYEYVEYPQLYPPYDPFVSILDLLFMTGPQALNFIAQRSDENAKPATGPSLF
jgi:WbqC-like protein family